MFVMKREQLPRLPRASTNYDRKWYDGEGVYPSGKMPMGLTD
jgi:hypothetical protein